LLTIDGSQGEGGGQILRSALALSLVTGRPFRIFHLRAGRARPGLLRQHLCAVRAAAEIGGAVVTGADLGSSELVFEPHTVRSGSYTFAVGSAGSATLVFQTVLPALMLAEETSTLELEGGTHNPAAPPYDFIARAFLPLLGQMGPRVSVTLERPGFYPAGGGRFVATIEPTLKLTPIDLEERGALLSRSASATVAALPRRIAERELARLAERLDWPRPAFHVTESPNRRGQATSSPSRSNPST
jgi:RNA 3'-terminal phosphate cyclase (ATP)